MADIGTIKEIRRYPVKSMEGETLVSAEIGSRGLAGDRAWAVRDEVRGGIRGAKKIPALMRLSAAYPSPPAATGSSPAIIRCRTARPAGRAIRTCTSGSRTRSTIA
jgi:uncharacterized protein YcbX